MIYQFRITSSENLKFLLDIEVDENHSFFDLHNSIQKSLEYEPYQLASFFISDINWRKLTEISMLDTGVNGGAYYIMHKTRISELIDSMDQKMIYTFDFINDRSFYLELTGIVMGKNLNEPLVAQKRGDAPVQVFGEEIINQSPVILLEEEVYMDFGEVDDYTELYGEMDDF